MADSGTKQWFRNGTVIAVLLCAALLVTLFCSCFSPLLSYIDCKDQCVFFRGGLAWTQGLTPYVDYKDVKGPLLFLLYKWGCDITPTSGIGVWIIETCSLFMLLLCLYKASRTCGLDSGRACLATVLSLFAMSQAEVYADGARAELFTGTALAGLIWQTCAFYKSRGASVRQYGLCVGACLSCGLLIKYNAAVTPLAAAAAACGYYAGEKRWRDVATMLLWLLLGAVILLLPFILYMVYAGNLSAMYDVYFRLNAQTLAGMQNIGLQRIGRIALNAWTFPAGLASVAACIGLRKQLCSRWAVAAILCMSASAYLVSVVGNYSYYMLYCAPVSIFAAIWLLAHMPSKLDWRLYVVVSVFTAVYAAGLNGVYLSRRGNHALFQVLPPDQQAMEDEICRKEGAKLLFVGTLDLGFGMKAGALPACPEWVTLNGAPELYKERQLDAIRSRKPDYVIVANHTAKLPDGFFTLLEQSGYGNTGLRIHIPHRQDMEIVQLYKKNK